MAKRTLKIKNDLDASAIKSILDDAYGRIENNLTIADIRSAIITPFCNRVMKGAIQTITCRASTCKTYKFRKHVGAATLKHNGKEWIFTGAYRRDLWAGQSLGGTDTVYRSDVRDEIVQTLCDRQGISFSSAFADAVTAQA